MTTQTFYDKCIAPGTPTHKHPSIRSLISIVLSIEVTLIILIYLQSSGQMYCDLCTPRSVLEINQLGLEVWCSETLTDAPSILRNVAGISV